MSKSKSDLSWKVDLFYYLIIFAALVCVANIVYIQLFEREKLIEYAEQREDKYFVEKAARGNILSSNGSLLATSVPRYNIIFDPVAVSDDIFDKEVSALADSLNRLFHYKTKSEYISMFKTARANFRAGKTAGTRSIKIATKATLDEYKRLREFPVFKYGRNKGGFISERVYVREKPYGKLASRTIGYTREDENDSLIVAVGLEGAYNDYLKGRNGIQKKRRLYGNAWIAENDDPNNMSPINGDDVYTSIDIELQDVAETALEKCLIENDALQGCVIMMDVESGLVEVMASLSYNEKTRKYEEEYNYALRQNVEPGSTFKAVTMLALLENDPDFNVDRKIYLGTTDYKVFYKRTIRDSHRVTDENGFTTIRNAFEQSSNIAFAYLVEDIFKDNPSRFVELIYNTKINEPLNLEIKGEAVPYIKNTSDKTWSKLTMPWMSFGYESMITPIQLLTFYNAIANDGVMVKPQFVKEVRNGKEVKYSYDTVVINDRIASPRTIKTMQELLRGVVVNGTAKNLNKLPFQVAGKTGTAQISQSGSYDRKNYTATFVGYFPADAPKYSCIVMISNPRGGKYYGGTVSAPVFRDLAEKIYATQLGIVEETGEYESNGDAFVSSSMVDYKDWVDYCNNEKVPYVDNVDNEKWVKVNTAVGQLYVDPVEIVEGIVPDVKGMNATDAVSLLESMGWRVTFSGFGKVKSQSVKAGSELKKGSVINLVLSAK